MAKELSLRIGVSDGERRSAVWSIFSTKNEVYAAHRTMGGIAKISLHSSGICRDAFVSSHGLPSTMSDRVLQRWSREQTLDAASKEIVCGLSVVFPTHQLSRDLSEIRKPVLWVAAAPGGSATILSVVFSRLSRDAFLGAISPAVSLIYAHVLPNGELVAIVREEAVDNPVDLVVPAMSPDQKEYVFPIEDRKGELRSVIFAMSILKEFMMCREFTGYEVTLGDGARLYPHADLLRRNQIIASGQHKSA